METLTYEDVRNIIIFAAFIVAIAKKVENMIDENFPEANQ